MELRERPAADIEPRNLAGENKGAESQALPAMEGQVAWFVQREVELGGSDSLVQELESRSSREDLSSAGVRMTTRRRD